MSNLISREQAIDAVKTYWKQQVDALDKHSGFETFTDACDAILKHNVGILNAIEQLPSAQPETHEKRTETHECDYISRQDAIEALTHEWDGMVTSVFDVVKALPSAQPEIIRCGQCKYAEVADKEDAQDGYTCQFHRGSIWFSGSYCSWAERRTDG